MTKKPDINDPLDIETDPLFDDSDNPISANELKAASVLNAPRIQCSKLVGREFDVLSAKVYNSEMNSEGIAYFCVVRPTGQSEVFTTTLGAVQFLPLIKEWLDMDTGRPLRMLFEEGRTSRGNRIYVLK